ncbi:hypothetical protein [Ferruginibacter albus]|uniref:hypothetical protein n=1 Tax=Ferruginibacter albus TaxID=2875540 RepID=UPI001CC81350|nr:hypothetical protein [Ferruginibacter albus]UAY53345.1 hypothetical protein K9M53_06655 [Ferruginibacter albus]
MSLELLKKVQYNKEARLHSVIEAGFKYEFPESLHPSFKNYIFRYDLVSRWYKQLSDEDRNKVNRTNAYG